MNVYVGVAYVDYGEEQRINRERHGDRKYNNGFSPIYSVYEFFTKLYLRTQKYVHCELFFPCLDENFDTHVVAFGVFSNEGVFMKKREFTNPAYRYIFLHANHREYSTVFQWCSRQVGKKFDEYGMRWSPFWPTRCSGEEWYCLSFTVAALNLIGILKTFQPTSLDTDDLVELLTVHPRKIEGILQNKLSSVNPKNVSIVPYRQDV